MFCDNNAVVQSTGRAESTLQKKHNAICWHAIREAIAAGWLRIVWESTHTNLADLFTKALPIPTRMELIGTICQYPETPEEKAFEEEQAEEEGC